VSSLPELRFCAGAFFATRLRGGEATPTLKRAAVAAAAAAVVTSAAAAAAAAADVAAAADAADADVVVYAFSAKKRGFPALLSGDARETIVRAA
jgi:hypothetical protein